jgi:hypothetical protein
MVLILHFFPFHVQITLPVENVENVDREKKVIEDRRFQIDASIVRIMKHYKIMGHQQLVAKCIAQLSTFKVLTSCLGYEMFFNTP